MGRAGLIALVGLFYLAAPIMVAPAQTVPIPQPAPKRTGSVVKPPASILPETRTPAPTRRGCLRRCGSSATS